MVTTVLSIVTHAVGDLGLLQVTCEEDRESYGSKCKDTFPHRHMDGATYQSVQCVPEQMTDCRPIAPLDFTRIICDSKSLQRVDSSQLPSPLNYLLVIGTSIKILNADSFDDIIIANLELVSNPISYVGPQAFSSLSGSKLENLTISDCVTDGLVINDTQSFFHPFSFLENLTSLRLENNSIALRGIDAIPKSNDSILLDLNYLSLANNPLERIEDGFFFVLRDSKVTQLNLQSCQLTSIGRNAFQYLPRLNHVDFYHNPSLFSLGIGWNMPLLTPLQFEGGLTSVGLGHNRILRWPRRILMMFNSTLTRLNLSGNQFEFLGSYMYANRIPLLGNLRELELSNSFIVNISEEAFASMPNLEKLVLRRNRLQKLFEAVLIPKLKVLDLAFQCVDADRCERNSGFVIPPNAFKRMENLQTLFLSGLHQTELRNNSLTGLSNLNDLHLDFTDLKELHNYTFSPLKKLKTLVLSHNPMLSSLPLLAFQGLDNLESLDLSYSPNIFRKKNDKNVYLPSTFEFENLRVLDLTCALNFFCTGKYDYGFTLNQTLLDRVPNLEEIHLCKNGLVSWSDRDLFSSNTRLTTLYMTNNQIVFLTDAMLDLFGRLKLVNFVDNPITCDINVYKFYKNIATLPTLTVGEWKSGEGYFCYLKENLNDPISFKQYAHRFESKIRTKSSASSLVIVLVLCASALVVVASATAIYRNRFIIGYYVYVWRNMTEKVPPVEENSEALFDVFISYSNEDSGFVGDQLLPYLEGQCGLRCCVHQRDFKVGLAVTDNIVDALDKSKTFMIVLSRSFIKSKWCQFEVHLAQCKFFKERKSNTLLLIKDGLKVTDVDRNMRHILKTWTYLRWPNHVNDRDTFWKRLEAAYSSSLKFSSSSSVKTENLTYDNTLVAIKETV